MEYWKIDLYKQMIDKSTLLQKSMNRKIQWNFSIFGEFTY